MPVEIGVESSAMVKFAKVKTLLFRFFYATLALGFGLGLVELGLRSLPHRLPGWYLASLPRGGYELLYPGVLENTPITGIPIPVSPRPMSNPEWHPAPRDLVHLGVAPSDETTDLENYPRVRFRFDEQGFPNPGPWSSTDVLFLGDSFTVATGALDPVGLQGQLQRKTGLEVGNLGVSGACPSREAYLLQKLGIGRKPKAVIWFLFGGNDLSEETKMVEAQEKGLRNYPNGKESYPTLFSINILQKSLKSTSHKSQSQPTPGFVLHSPANSHSIWFHPDYLKRMGRSKTSLRDSPGWTSSCEAILRAVDLLKKRDIKLLLVYIPSKPQVYLQYVERDPSLLRQTMGLRHTSVERDEELWEQTLNESDNLELAFSEFANEHHIDFLSLTPRLRVQAKEGKVGYLIADTHWNQNGQEVALKPLGSWIEAQGLTTR